MPVSVDWGSQVITVPQDYLTFVSGTTYQLNVNTLRLTLKDLEDDLTGGMPYLDTHRHIAPITLSGTTYSRFIEIINDYTITFEDGFYQVNLSGANNNIVDVLNRNSVSVVANNSSGLISSDQLEYSSFQNRITIDTVNGVSGTTFPIGTVGTPVNNISDALLIAQGVGITQLFFKNSYTIASGIDLTNYELVGEAPSRTTLTFESGSITTNVEIINSSVEGYLGNIAGLTNCHLLNITETSDATGVEMNIYDCVFDGNFTLSSGLSGDVQIFNCKSGVAGSSVPIFDVNSSSVNFFVRDYTGGIEIRNITNGNIASLDFLSGQVLFASTCTTGTVVVRGLCKIVNNASGNPNFTLSNEVTVTATDVENIAAAVWDKLVASHIDSGTFGEKVGRKLLTTGKFIALK